MYLLKLSWQKWKRSRAAVILKSLRNSELGKIINNIMIVVLIGTIFYLWWYINYLLVTNEILSLLAVKGKDAHIMAAVFWMMLEITFIIVSVLIVGSCHFIISDLMKRMRSDLEKYDIEAAKLNEKRKT
jgi:hypothetical protein